MPWPTLRELIEHDQRLVVLAENQAGAAPFYQLAYEHLMHETPFSFGAAAELTTPATLPATCRPNRGPDGAPLFLVNHWINTDPAPRPSNATLVNAYAPLLARARTCERDPRATGSTCSRSTSTSAATCSRSSTPSTACRETRMADGITYELARMRTRDGDDTTVYLVRHPLRTTRVSVICFVDPTRLDQWCAATGHPEAIVAGFFVRDPYRPLGEVRIDGEPVAHESIADPWGPLRACVHIDGSIRLAPRQELGADPPGDLVQAGPMLVRDGRSVIDGNRSRGLLERRRAVRLRHHDRAPPAVCAGRQ